MSKLNPNAPSFEFNPKASEFPPSSGTQNQTLDNTTLPTPPGTNDASITNHTESETTIINDTG